VKTNAFFEKRFLILTRPKISHRWRGRAWIAMDVFHKQKRGIGAASGWLHRLVRCLGRHEGNVAKEYCIASRNPQLCEADASARRS
jgi:hypothetical protein